MLIASFQLAIPAEADKRAKNGDNEFLRSVGEFRSRRRIPVLSWVDPRTSVTITRSSQPMVGVTSRKSSADEE